MNQEQRFFSAEKISQDQKAESKGPITFFREHVIKPAATFIAIESALLASHFQEKAYADQEVEKKASMSMLQNKEKFYKVLTDGSKIFYLKADISPKEAEEINKEYNQSIDTQIKGSSIAVNEPGDPEIKGDEIEVREFFLTFLDDEGKQKGIASRLTFDGVVKGANPYKGKAITKQMLKARDINLEKLKLADRLNYLRMKMKILNAFYALEKQNTLEAVAVKKDIIDLIEKTKKQYGDESVNEEKTMSELKSWDEIAKKRVEQKPDSR